MVRTTALLLPGQKAPPGTFAGCFRPLRLRTTLPILHHSSTSPDHLGNILNQTDRRASSTRPALLPTGWDSSPQKGGIRRTPGLLPLKVPAPISPTRRAYSPAASGRWSRDATGWSSSICPQWARSRYPASPPPPTQQPAAQGVQAPSGQDLGDIQARPNAPDPPAAAGPIGPGWLRRPGRQSLGLRTPWRRQVPYPLRRGPQDRGVRQISALRAGLPAGAGTAGRQAGSRAAQTITQARQLRLPAPGRPGLPGAGSPGV